MPAEMNACVGGSVRKLERLWSNHEVEGHICVNQEALHCPQPSSFPLKKYLRWNQWLLSSFQLTMVFELQSNKGTFSE